MGEPDSATQPLPRLDSATVPLGPHPGYAAGAGRAAYEPDAGGAGMPWGASSPAPVVDAASPRRPRRRRRGVVLALAAAVLAVLLVTAELVARALVGGIVAERVAESLPSTVRAEIHAAPTGGCVLCELAVGRLSGVDLRAAPVNVGEITGEIDATVRGAKLGDPVRVESLEGTVEIDAAPIEKLLRDAAAAQGIPLTAVRFGDGEIDYRVEAEVFGARLGADVTSRLELRSGGRLRIVGTGISFDADGLGLGIDVDPGNFSLDVCLAEHLPAALEVTRVRVRPEGLDVDVRSTGEFEASETAFAELGSCR